MKRGDGSSSLSLCLSLSHSHTTQLILNVYQGTPFLRDPAQPPVSVRADSSTIDILQKIIEGYY